ncbi:MAG: cyclic pyranopterin monophosphate synthase MoaC [Candidatus Njordarchaeales archaeon]
MKDVKMVDITEKVESFRTATAVGRIKLRKETLRRILEGLVEKGDVFSVSKIVAISGAKKTPDLLPFCHPIPITNVSVDIRPYDHGLEVEVTVKSVAKTGVEMEALTGVTLALLNIWDMVKKYEKDEKGQYPYTVIEEIRVVKKEKHPLSEDK